MLTAIIAVIGTLAGTGLGVLGNLAGNRAAFREQRRTAAVNALGDLVSALDAHRRTMWIREDRRLRGEDWTDARAASHETRTAISAPLTRFIVLAPGMRDQARAAAAAVYGLRDAATRADLDAARELALVSVQALTDSAHL
ncbi:MULTISPECIES: protein kilB [unclassified Streptomyces]|uniref:protein kilB n=1 Tax=unclassified Streptomyces TaxID=2593676 RepID=UPI0038308A28